MISSNLGAQYRKLPSRCRVHLKEEERKGGEGWSSHQQLRQVVGGGGEQPTALPEELKLLVDPRVPEAVHRLHAPKR